MKFVREQFFLAAAAQNIKPLVASSANCQGHGSPQPLSQTLSSKASCLLPQGPSRAPFFNTTMANASEERLLPRK